MVVLVEDVWGDVFEFVVQVLVDFEIGGEEQEIQFQWIMIGLQ